MVNSPQTNALSKEKAKLRKAKQRSQYTPERKKKQREYEKNWKSQQRTMESPVQAQVRREKND
jgi:hypothetical protein